MAKKIRPNTSIGAYRVERFIHDGPKAISYLASAADGAPVFLKQFKSPTVRVKWYREYVKYEREKMRRIDTSGASKFCVRYLDVFEAEHGPMTLFQAFEFVEAGDNLRVVLNRLAGAAPPNTWRQRLIIAKVLTAAVHSLHLIGIVHGDLKPENVQLIEDSSISAKFRTKLIDMDSSVLVDRPPPWEGHEGHIGTENYFSPEHLRREIPVPASDVFTCALILYELLTGEHPCQCRSPEEYLERVDRREIAEPRLLGHLDSPEASKELRATMHRALSPIASERPSAETMHDALNGRVRADVVATSSSAIPTPPVGHGTLSLLNEGGARLTIHVATELTRALTRRFGADAKFVDTPQCSLVPSERHWTVIPNPKAQNETLINGEAVTESRRLLDGDRLAVGRASKNVTKLELTVRIESVP